MQPTMRSIAREAGVSAMTVSLALKDNPRISKKTREKVKRVAHEMGYRTNPMVSSLMAHVRSTRPIPYQANLAFLSAFQEKDAMQHSLFTRRAYRGMCDRAEELGFLIDTFWLNQKDMHQGRIEKILTSRNIQGVILSPLDTSGTLEFLDWSQWSSTALGDSLLSPCLHHVTHHQFHGISLILEHLAQKGYRKIGLAVDAISDDKVGNAWSACMAGHQLRIRTKDRVPIFFASEPFLEAGQKKFSAWLDRYQPEVIIGHDGILTWMSQMKLRIPRDFAFAHLSLPRENSFYRQLDFSGLNQKWEKIGSAAVDLVVAQIHRNERGIPTHPKTILLQGSWLEGDTTPDL